MPAKELWKDKPEEHDYAGAAAFLSLLLPPAVAAQVVDALRAAPMAQRRAKDILRAADLPILGDDDAHVARDLDKVKDGDKLSPVLLVRGRLEAGRPLVVADGYHRICASFQLDSDSEVPCRIADLP